MKIDYDLILNCQFEKTTIFRANQQFLENLLLGSHDNTFFSPWKNVLYTNRYSDMSSFLAVWKILINHKHQQAMSKYKLFHLPLF